MDAQVYVISANRSKDLPFNAQQKKEYIFCVPRGQRLQYQTQGCAHVLETGNLIDSRNTALQHAFAHNRICIQLSDDLKAVKTNPNIMEEPRSVCLWEALALTLNRFNQCPELLCGVPPTDNAFFAKTGFSRNTFCVGDMIMVKPCDLEFDPNLRLKEDYDYTLQHIHHGRGAIRYQAFLYAFKHYKNPGGAVSYRTEQLEQQTIKYLQKKWGNNIALNPQRKNEIKLIPKLNEVDPSQKELF